MLIYDDFGPYRKGWKGGGGRVFGHGENAKMCHVLIEYTS